MTEERSLAVPEPVMPLITAEKAAANWKAFEELKKKLLSAEDYQMIQDKQYIKRSGFRKLAVVFGISDQIIKEERAERPDGSFVWRIEVEALAPNGRRCVGVGACDSKERNFAHLEHDVYSTAHTRAKSRAISDLVAGGAVSAEEVEVSTSPTVAGEPTPSKPSSKEPKAIEDGTQFPLVDGLDQVGVMNVTESEIALIPRVLVKSDVGPIQGFLVPKLDAMKDKIQGFAYNIFKDAKDNITEIIIVGKLDEKQIKELQNEARWSFSKARNGEKK